MKKLIPLLLLAVSGCVHMPAIWKQLKNDPAKIDLEINTIYGNVKLHREFPTNWTQPINVVMPSTVTTNNSK